MDDEVQGPDDIVRRFEQACASGATMDLGQFLPPAGPERIPALHELIKSDLEAHWRRGHPVRLEEYLARFPELGTARTVPAVLIVAEFRARTLYGDRPALEVYQRRFPDQFAECERLARAAALLDVPTQIKAADVVRGPATPSKAVEPSYDTPTPGKLQLPTPAAPVAPRPPGGAGPTPAKGPEVVGPGAPGSSPVRVSRDYKLFERIGAGGFAEVWRGEAPGGFPVAVKAIFRPIDHEEAQRELKALETVQRFTHPYLLQTHACWPDDGKLYVAMELAECSLRDRLKVCRQANQAGVPIDELLRYFRESAEALDYLHSEKVQHRDIKPDNILILKGHAKVADFGLARLHERPVTMTVTGSGTPAYMAPETWAGKLHPQSDQYSFAVTYAELRLGRRPFTGASPAELMMAHLEAKPDLAPLGEAEQQVIRKALAREPSERFGSCGEFVAALEAALPTEVAPARGRKSARDTSPLRKDEAVSAGATDKSLAGPSAPRGRRTNLSDTRPPSAVKGWRDKGRAGALPVVVVLVGITLIMGGLVVAAKWLPKPRPTGGQDTGLVALPSGFEKADAAQVVTERGRKYYEKIDRVVEPDKLRIPFILILQDQPGSPRGEDVGPFYIMVDKVTVDLYSRFAKEKGAKNDQWQHEPCQGKQPVMGVTATEAYRCASWLKGNLPTRRQWDKAAGLYRGPEKGPWPAPWDEGPFLNTWNPKDLTGIALDRPRDKGPMEVGTADKDRTYCGCHDMAGNGREFTRDLVKPDDDFPLDREPRRDDRIFVRGQRYTFDEPVRFKKLDSLTGQDSIGYMQPGDETGFRVVLEPPAPDSTAATHR